MIKKLFRTLFRWVNVGLIVALVLAYLAPYVSPESFWMPSFFGLLFPYLFAATLGFLLFFITRKGKIKRVAILNVLALIVGFNHFTNTLSFGSQTVENKAGINLTVLTNNVLHFRNTELKAFDKKVELTNNFLDLYSEYKPEILCFQESYLPRDLANHVSEYLTVNLGVKYNYYHQNLTIHSKYPIVNKGFVETEKYKNFCIYTDIKVDTTIFRVYSVHLSSNRITSEAENFIETPTAFDNSETWKTIKGILGKVRTSSKIRASQSEAIAQHIAGSPHPVIVCGDFNETPVSYNYHNIRQNLTDAFVQHSFGIGSTYAGSIPSLRIDYILADERFNIVSHQNARKAFSDHYPVISVVNYD